jgi:hypothetical protein
VLSFLRKQESKLTVICCFTFSVVIPAFAGMTPTALAVAVKGKTKIGGTTD